MLFNAGIQLPEIPFKEVVGNGEMLDPLQTGETVANVGLIKGLTVMIIVVLVPIGHCPAVGVKV